MRKCKWMCGPLRYQNLDVTDVLSYVRASCRSPKVDWRVDSCTERSRYLSGGVEKNMGGT